MLRLAAEVGDTAAQVETTEHAARTAGITSYNEGPDYSTWHSNHLTSEWQAVFAGNGEVLRRTRRAKKGAKSGRSNELVQNTTRLMCVRQHRTALSCKMKNEAAKHRIREESDLMLEMKRILGFTETRTRVQAASDKLCEVELSIAEREARAKAGTGRVKDIGKTHSRPDSRSRATACS
eukprot:6214289-Pleurochrysis_carterae.AAC.2